MFVYSNFFAGTKPVNLFTGLSEKARNPWGRFDPRQPSGLPNKVSIARGSYFDQVSFI
jgi:hypothetical protein